MHPPNLYDAARRLSVCILAAAAWCAGCVVANHEIQTVRVPVPVGSDTLEVVVHTSDEPGLTYVSLHDDENTAVSAALSTLRLHGGRLVELRHSGERSVRFSVAGAEYGFDPNRIFTDRGIRSTLAAHGGSSDTARAVVRGFADRLLDIVGFDTLASVVAVHNNTPEEYSVRSYTSGGAYAGDARFVHVTADTDADDFFFVTTESVYTELRAAGYNVVLQDNQAVRDDGSLSVAAARRGLPYVNAEAEHGRFEAQERMLILLHQLTCLRSRSGRCP